MVVALAAVGILMVYSSSAMRGYLSADADTFQTVGPQIQWALLGIVAMVAMMRIDYRYLRLISVPAYAAALGLLALVGGTLTMASIAALPILIGLAVDYAIQFQARFDESGSARDAAAAGGPTIATACLATAAGFLALQLSPIPMVRGFGWLLIVGIAIAFVLALTTGLGTLALWRAGPVAVGDPPSPRTPRGWSPLRRHPPEGPSCETQ